MATIAQEKNRANFERIVEWYIFEIIVFFNALWFVWNLFLCIQELFFLFFVL